LRATGTVHLLVISGLHVGVVGGGILALVLVIHRLLAVFCAGLARWLPPTLIGLALLGCYVLFVGAGTSAIRAYCMLSAGVVALQRVRAISPAALMLFALCVVLLFVPAAGSRPGFWLSFALVGWLLFGAQLPGPAQRSTLKRLGGLLRLHLSCSLILVPALLWLELPVALVGVVANFIAVPWVTLLLVPLLLLGGLAVGLVPDLGWPLLAFLDWQIAALFSLLGWLADLSPAARFGSVLLWQASLIAVVLVLALLPVAPVVRWTGALLLAMLLLAGWSVAPATIVQLRPGEFLLTVLDVGQGTAVLVRTADRALLYDTGASFPSGFSFAEAVIMPALQHSGVEQLDMLIVSHSDNDHAGGVDYLVGQVPMRRRILGATGECAQTAPWVWDGVHFELLQADLQALHLTDDNNASCVLVIAGPTSTLVLAGDIERDGEAALLSQLPGDVDVLLVPHHGSHTSSTLQFVEHLQPVFGLVSAGYANKFGHPHPQVVQRYQRHGTRVVSTATAGAIHWSSVRPDRLVLQRAERARRWQLGAPLLVLGLASSKNDRVME